MNIFRLRMVWERLARDDPYWAVLTVPGTVGNQWKLDEFFATGRTEVAANLAMIAQHVPHAPRGRALDFGCGVGRLSQALADHYDEVIGVDVAERMVRLAREHNRHPSRVQFVHNPRQNLRRFADASMDLVFSLITLQHIPPKVSKGYLREFVRVVKPGGVIWFQLPTHVPPPLPRRKAWSWYPPTVLKRIRQEVQRLTGLGDGMRMHALTAEEVKQVLADAGAEVIATEPHSMGDGLLSSYYLARRRAEPGA